MTRSSKAAMSTREYILAEKLARLEDVLEGGEVVNVPSDTELRRSLLPRDRCRCNAVCRSLQAHICSMSMHAKHRQG